MEKLGDYIRRLERELVEEIITICQIPAPTFDETARGEYIAGRFTAEGLEDVHRDESGNVIGMMDFSQPGPVMLLAAHMDTVFSRETDVTVRRKGNTLHAPGVGDNSANVAGIIYLARLLSHYRNLFKGRIYFVSTVGEEALGDLMGMKTVMDRYHKEVDRVCIVDSRQNIIFYRGVHSIRLRIVCKGPGGHSWGSYGKSSAVHVMSELVGRTARLDCPADPKSTYNYGVIQGGTAVNAIAESCETLLDIRSLDDGQVSRFHGEVLDIIKDLESSDIVFTVETVGNRPGGYLEENSVMAEKVLDLQKQLGIEGKLAALSTDGNVSIEYGVPTVGFGIYDGAGAHTMDEYIDETSLCRGLELLARFVHAMLRVSSADWA